MLLRSALDGEPFGVELFGLSERSAGFVLERMFRAEAIRNQSWNSA
ncbi:MULTISPECIES: hypothetical protein [unclassified Thiocapsa]